MNIRNNLRAVLVLILVWSCNTSEYNSLVEKEVAKGDVYDSLFLNITMGMNRKDFYGLCWEMNKQGLIQQGPNNLSVQYKLDSNDLKYQGFMHFYPVFEEDTISVMPMQFTYEAFIPTDSSLLADGLLLDVKQMLERWYGGNQFIYMEDDEGARKLWVKVDGNRRIRIFVKDIRTVSADIMDLRSILSKKQGEE